MAREYKESGDNWWRLHRKVIVEDVEGWAAWSYSHMYTMDRIKVEQ